MTEVDLLCKSMTLNRNVGSNVCTRTAEVRRLGRTEVASSGGVRKEADKQLSSVSARRRSEGEDMDGLEVDDVSGNSSFRKKKHRRGKPKKRKWKPYYKLSWQERRELDEKEAQKANRIRAEMFALGQPLAPYNTTQFLMEDHNVQEPDYERMPNGHRHYNRENSADSSDEFYSSPEDEEDFLQKQFSEAYEDIHAERLNSMSKTELVQEYIQLEVKVEELENRLKESSGVILCTAESEVQTPLHEEAEKIRIFMAEMRHLTEENERLRHENELLQNMIGSSVSLS